jgi:competence protein ComEC
MKTPLRWCGAVMIVLASALAIRAPLPDVLVSADGQAMAVRGADGRLAVHRTGSDVFAVRQWLAADGDARLPADPALRAGFACDEAGCIAKLPDGKLVARILAPDAFEEDCRRALVVVTTRDAPPACAALTIDRKALRAGGALLLQRAGDGFEVTAARPAGQDRPWARARPEPVEGARTPTVTRPTPRDATPRAEDLEAGD